MRNLEPSAPDVTTKLTIEKHYSDSVTLARIPMPYHCPVRQLLSKVRPGIQKTKKTETSPGGLEPPTFRNHEQE